MEGKLNTLIETSYQLGSREQFFVIFLISHISQTDTDFKEYKMHYSDIVRILNFDGRRRIANKKDIFRLMNNLNQQPIRFSKGDEDIQVVWISKLRHNKKTNIFTFTFSDELREYLLQLRQHFTRYNISNIVYLTGHSIRMYELLKRHQFKGKAVFLVEQLKFFLGIPEKYSEFYEFKRRVLLPSQKELKKFTDIQFVFKPHKKEGRKIVSLLFEIYENTPEKIPKELILLSELNTSNTVTKQLPQNIKGGRKTLQQFTWSQTAAYHFLVEKGVNNAFVSNKVLHHPKVKYEVLQGFEDIYIRIVWAYFEKKTKAKKLAGAFVSWWKKGRLTEDGLHAKHIELILKRQKTLSAKELDNRQIAKRMTNENYQKYLEQETPQASETASSKIVQALTSTMDGFSIRGSKTKSVFNFEQFKQQHSALYMEYMNQVINDYKKTFAHSNQTFDFNKYAKSIEEQVKYLCQEWTEQQNEKMI